jgi:hypothetical protein
MYLTDCKNSPSFMPGVQSSFPMSLSFPDMVYVFPEPVYPYAKIVAA